MGKLQAVSSRSTQRGVVILTLAVALMILFGFVALAIDVGYMQWTKRRAQTAADAAAMAAITERWRGSSDTMSDAAALTDASRNGFTNGSESTTVTITNSGGALSSSILTAVVTRQVPTYFMRVLGRDSVTIAARAAAQMGDGESCVYVLNPSAHNAFVVSGGSQVSVNCGIQVNSDATTNAFMLHGNGSIDLNGNTIGVVGDWASSGTIIDGGFSHTANTGDPLFYLNAPESGSLTEQTVPSSSPYNLQPGIYCGGINFTGGNTYNLAPGVYVLAGGRSTVQTGATVTGTGITFVLSSERLYCGSGPDSLAGFDINSGATLNISAPTSGYYKDIAFFEDRRVDDSNNTSTFNGGSSVTINGGIYLPQSNLTLNGNLTTANISFMIADTMTINGQVNPTANFAGGSGSSPFKTARLIE